MKTAMLARSSIALAALVLASATASTANAQSAAAPAFKVGDRWVYDVKSGIGLTATTYQETREVTAVGTGGIKIKVREECRRYGILPHRRFRRAGRAWPRTAASKAPIQS